MHYPIYLNGEFHSYLSDDRLRILKRATLRDPRLWAGYLVRFAIRLMLALLLVSATLPLLALAAAGAFPEESLGLFSLALTEPAALAEMATFLLQCMALASLCLCALSMPLVGVFEDHLRQHLRTQLQVGSGGHVEIGTAL